MPKREVILKGLKTELGLADDSIPSAFGSLAICWAIGDIMTMNNFYTWLLFRRKKKHLIKEGREGPR